ncbi:NADP-dependent phosphogluconate dehydrogenase [uncultured Lacinutrix sp.]|uniref:NADP-dependent phosphogluconate dehydrogenase n=1 Tax=uncultured Lacinutrix sp. TaxID=574032 RepID=UPI00261593C9|nr:NADP-dependent phosphogluconate dehydrogenase [uncultured Lacinutrix sp.]
MKNRSFFGVIGLGVMGKSLALNIAGKGHTLSVYNRSVKGEEAVVSDFLEENNDMQNIKGFVSMSKFIDSIQTPRKILIMIKAGTALDDLIKVLLPLLSANDIVIDGGNSHYLDTKKRSDFLKAYNINFIGAGISGGQEGAKKGPSIMPGGSRSSYENVAVVLESIAAKDKNGKPCCSYIGPDGSGHFVKMVHNGIEYAEMQLIAEMYQILSVFMSNEDIAKVFEFWNKGESSSYLLEITTNILRKKEKDSYLVDLILDKAGSKGTGSWSSKAALDIGVPNTMMNAAVFARYISSYKSLRKLLSKQVKRRQYRRVEISLAVLEKAYYFARIINHNQGFQLIEQASLKYQWELNLSEIARVWTNGCIIKSSLMNELVRNFNTTTSLFDNRSIIKDLNVNEDAVSEVIKYVVSNRIAAPNFCAAYNYWIGITTNQSSANLIQAQRDYFGAHTYNRIDAPLDVFFHTNWK